MSDVKYIVVQLDKDTSVITDVLSGPFDTKKEAVVSKSIFMSQGKMNLEVWKTHVIKLKENG